MTDLNLLAYPWELIPGDKIGGATVDKKPTGADPVTVSVGGKSATYPRGQILDITRSAKHMPDPAERVES